MTVPIAGDPTIAGVVLAEQAATPTSPAAGKRKLFVTSAGVARLVDATGTATDVAATQVHALVGPSHSSSGGTDGYALHQTGATTFTWEPDYAAIAFTLGDGLAAITTAEPSQWIEVPFDCLILRVTLVADVAGSIVVDLWADTYANYPPTVADSITASARPTLASAIKSQDATLTGWTTALARGSILKTSVLSAATLARVVLSLAVRKT